MKQKPKKMFIIRKYIIAENATQAIRLDKKTKVDDVFIDNDWKEGKNRQLESAIGFDNGHFPD
jgi:hypothetical protein